jgi:hypothetical protein
MNIMPTHIWITIKYGRHELFLNWNLRLDLQETIFQNTLENRISNFKLQKGIKKIWQFSSWMNIIPPFIRSLPPKFWPVTTPVLVCWYNLWHLQCCITSLTSDMSSTTVLICDLSPTLLIWSVVSHVMHCSDLWQSLNYYFDMTTCDNTLVLLS